MLILSQVLKNHVYAGMDIEGTNPYLHIRWVPFHPINKFMGTKIVQTYAIRVSLGTPFYQEIFIFSRKISLFFLGKIEIA